MAGTSPAMTLEKWFIVTDIRSAYFRDWGKYFKSGGA
jgi:hypothetical protein